MIYRDFIAMLQTSRSLSTFGPDFSDPVTLKTWFSALHGIPDASLAKAITQLSGNREFATPNEIKDLCKQINNQAAMLPEVAFDLLWRKIGSVGRYGLPELPNEIGLAVERLGGWAYLCDNWSDDKREWHEKAFREIYGNVSQAKAHGLLSLTSRYTSQELEGDKPKQISGKVQEALRMAVAASEPHKPNLSSRLKEIKRSKK